MNTIDVNKITMNPLTEGITNAQNGITEGLTNVNKLSEDLINKQTINTGVIIFKYSDNNIKIINNIVECYYFLHK